MPGSSAIPLLTIRRKNKKQCDWHGTPLRKRLTCWHDDGCLLYALPLKQNTVTHTWNPQSFEDCSYSHVDSWLFFLKQVFSSKDNVL